MKLALAPEKPPARGEHEDARHHAEERPPDTHSDALRREPDAGADHEPGREGVADAEPASRRSTNEEEWDSAEPGCQCGDEGGEKDDGGVHEATISRGSTEAAARLAPSA
jgi:hypothetical protein